TSSKRRFDVVSSRPSPPTSGTSWLQHPCESLFISFIVHLSRPYLPCVSPYAVFLQTDADLNELRWRTKQRVILALLAEIPEGRHVVVECTKLQAERSRSRKEERAAGAMPEVGRKAEDQFREAFFRVVAGALGHMGAAPALSGPKRLNADTGVCLRAIGFLAARAQGRQRRKNSPSITAAKFNGSPGADVSVGKVIAPHLGVHSSDPDLDGPTQCQRLSLRRTRTGDRPVLKSGGVSSSSAVGGEMAGEQVARSANWSHQGVRVRGSGGRGVTQGKRSPPGSVVCDTILSASSVVPGGVDGDGMGHGGSRLTAEAFGEPPVTEGGDEALCAVYLSCEGSLSGSTRRDGGLGRGGGTGGIQQQDQLQCR
ncbi:unnamed protein product, partial [Choristocarpus tenellus]